MKRPEIAVVVPFRPSGCPFRQRAWEWVQGRYATEHPGWDVVTGSGPDGVWCKAAAVADALTQTDAEVLVVADADVWCDGLAQAVSVTGHGFSWAIPHMSVHRLTREATDDVLGEGRTGLDATVERPYRGILGGGIVVLTRAAYERVPLDPRFVGWGQEDLAWGHALTCLAGRHWRGHAPLIHLWHPPADRVNRAVGSEAGQRLQRRYKRAMGSRKRMTSILREAKELEPDAAPDTPHHDRPKDRVGH